MKKAIIISLILITLIYCNLDSCVNEQDYSNCPNHEIELKKFSCYKLWNSDNGDNRRCFPFPNEPVDREYFWDLLKGNTAEFESVFPGTSRNYFDILLAYAEEGDEIHAYSINGTVSTEYMDTLESQNTCFYQYYGRYYNNDNKNYENITDKNICYNVNHFIELENKVNCGYGEIKYIENGKTYGIKSCFFVPNKTMSIDMRKIYKKYFVDKLFEKGYFPSISNSSSKRRLQNNKIIDYEIIVEDKDGQKLKYSYDSDDIEYIEDNVEKPSDMNINVSETDNSDEPIKLPIAINGSGFIGDKILFLLFILLIL